MSSADDIQARTDEWSRRLVGQTIVQDPNSHRNTFSHDDLPKKHRICPPGTLLTRDFDEERLNIFTDEDGSVTHVTIG